MITICLTYFRSLALANLRAALHSVRWQDLSRVTELVILDNNTDDAFESIIAVIEDEIGHAMPWRLISEKHQDETRTHSWSTNRVIREAKTPWVFFTRADYILDAELLGSLASMAEGDRFLTSDVCHLGVDVGVCNTSDWRELGTCALLRLPNRVETYTDIDAGVYMLHREAFDRVGGLDEGLSAWGHAQTHFQYKLHSSGTTFHRIERPMYFHPLHSGPRDIAVANEQLAAIGIDIRDMWMRYAGPKPY